MNETKQQRALVVDDSRAMRLILGRNLRELGYTVEEAANGREALNRLTGDNRGFALALIDWNMPEMNGLELLRAMRANPELAGMAIIMVTTETEMEQMMTALEAGVNEYIMKPFTPEILVDKLRLVGAV